MSAIVVINEGVCLGRGRSQFLAGVVLVIKRFHRESDICCLYNLYRYDFAVLALPCWFHFVCRLLMTCVLA